MNVKEEFYRIMATQTEIALATDIANVPNVRIVNWGCGHFFRPLTPTSFCT